MNDELTLMRLIPGQRQVVFDYFVRPELLELWSAPHGMKLRVPVFEAQIGGSYRFEHSTGDKTYICTGNVKDMEPGSKLIQIDHVEDSDGKIIFNRLETVTTFNQKPGGTFVTVTQRGFTDQESLKDCERGWNECFDRLVSLMNEQERSASL